MAFRLLSLGDSGGGLPIRDLLTLHLEGSWEVPSITASQTLSWHQLVQLREGDMTPVLLTTLEHHRFEAAGRPFVHLLSSAAIFALDEAADAIVRLLSARARTRESLVRELADGDVDSRIDELIRMRVIGEVEPAPKPMPKIVPLQPFR